MPVIAFANGKGGVGKSTAALTLATTLAHRGATVTALDCDPNLPLKTWSGGQSESSVRVLAGITESSIIATMDEARIASQFVLVDLEGVGSRLVSRAISRCDLCIIPMQTSSLDAASAAKAIQLIREEEAVLSRPIAFRLLMMRTNPAIKTKTEKMIASDLARVGAPVLGTALNERTAYRSQFVYRLALHELKPSDVNGLAGAIRNAEALTDEIVQVLRDLNTRRIAA